MMTYRLFLSRKIGSNTYDGVLVKETDSADEFLRNISMLRGTLLEMGVANRITMDYPSDNFTDAFISYEA